MLLFGLDDIATYCLLSLVPLRREVRPGFGMIKRHRVVQAVPFDNRRVLGRRRTLYGNDSPIQCAESVTMGSLAMK